MINKVAKARIEILKLYIASKIIKIAEEVVLFKNQNIHKL